MIHHMVSVRAGGLQASIIRDMSRQCRPSSINLTLGQPSLPPDASVLAAAMRRMETDGFGYTENAGLAELRQIVAEHHGLDNRRTAGHVCVTVGCEQAIYLALTTVVDPQEEVLIPALGFPAYPGICRLLGAEPVLYPIDRKTGLVPRADAIEPLITPKTKALVLNDPSNPFGTCMDADEVRKLAALAERHDLVVISDEIYQDLRYEGQHASICEHTERALLIGGLSKSCAFTGLRLGYVIGPKAFVAAATLVNQLQVTCAPRPAQYAAIEVFRKPDILKAHVPYYEQTRARLRKEAEALPDDATLWLGEGAFYAVLDVSAYVDFEDPMALAMALVEAEDVVVVPGRAFGPGGDWFWRMSYAGGPDVAGEGLSRIARFLNGRRR